MHPVCAAVQIVYICYNLFIVSYGVSGWHDVHAAMQFLVVYQFCVYMHPVPHTLHTML